MSLGEKIMRRLLSFTLTVASVLGWASVAGAADPPDDPAPVKKSSGLLSILGLRKTEKKEAAPKLEARPIKIDAEALRARELLDHTRRLEVCLRLKEIAIQTRDSALEAQAEELEHRAFELYRQRLAELATDTRGALADEHRLRRGLSDGRAQDRLAGATDRNRSSAQRAAVREDN
jgi:hypothetical protein